MGESIDWLIDFILRYFL